MSKNRIVRGIGFEPDVFKALESLRGNRQHFRSEYINKLLREKLGLEKKTVGDDRGIVEA